jgi:formamidopyrimidine-DNA glycosylase
MPELAEAEAICRRLRKQAGHARILSGHVEREKIVAPQSADQIEALARNATVEAVHRRGKQVLIDLDNGHTMRIHLGMTGDVYVTGDHRMRPHSTRAWFRLADGRALIFDDPRALGHLNIYQPGELKSVLGDLGLEPMSPAFTPEALQDLAAGSRLPVKRLLMDQTKIAGLGNIYAAESLFEAGIDPRKRACRLRRWRTGRLQEAIVRVLRDAIQSACIAYMRPGRFWEAEGFAPQVYGRVDQPCNRCGRRIRRIQQGGRSTYFCPGCQT